MSEATKQDERTGAEAVHGKGVSGKEGWAGAVCRTLRNSVAFLSCSLLFLSFGQPGFAFSNGIWRHASAAGGVVAEVPARTGIATIRDRIVRQLLEGETDPSLVRRYIDALAPDGSWPDINYTDTSRTGFQHSAHLSRMVAMSRAYRKEGGVLAGGAELKEAFGRALNYWLQHDFICENWWWNQIGVPTGMVNILLIMGPEHLSQAQWKGVVRIAGRAHLEASGARPSGDRIVIAGILAKKLLAVEDSVQFAEVVKVIEGEIKFSTGRGMQYDYSFHHRDDRVNNTLSYGISYTSSFAEWAAYLAGTSFALSDQALRHLTDYYLDGICRMLSFGKYPDPGAKNRGITRRGALKAMGNSIPERLLTASKYRAAELERIIAIRNGGAQTPQLHTTFFWHSEHFSHQRPEYFASVRMFSSRNHNMEVPYNGEGLLNHYLGNGSNFLSRTGTEYYDIFPVFDYHKIPGATLVQFPSFPDPGRIQQKGVTDFVGGVSDGLFGAAAFDFRSERDSVKARKAWFFFDGKYLCLGAGITSPSASPVVTTVNQCWLRGPVVTGEDRGRGRLGKGEYNSGELRWVWHDSVGYLFPGNLPGKRRPGAAAGVAAGTASSAARENVAGPASGRQAVHVSGKEQSGSWYRINQQSDSPKDPLRGEVFKLWIDHGIKPQDADYAYVVMPGISPEELARSASGSPLNILANTGSVQAAEDPEQGLVQMVFYEPGTLELSGGISFTAETAGLFMVQRKGKAIRSVTVSDPSRKLKQIRFSVDVPLALADDARGPVEGSASPEKGSELSAGLPGQKQGSPAGGEDVVIHRVPGNRHTAISLALPQGVYAGKSVTVRFREER